MKVISKGALIEMSTADRDIIDEIIFALNTLSEVKKIFYDKEIEWLIKLREL